jgi:hypothetical protein
VNIGVRREEFSHEIIFTNLKNFEIISPSIEVLNLDEILSNLARNPYLARLLVNSQDCNMKKLFSIVKKHFWSPILKEFKIKNEFSDEIIRRDDKNYNLTLKRRPINDFLLHFVELQ